MTTAAKIHAILKKAGVTKSQLNISQMVRGYRTRSTGYYLDVEKVENPDWGINSYRRSQRDRWLATGRVIVKHTDDSQLPRIAEVLAAAGIACDCSDGSKVVAGEDER